MANSKCALKFSKRLYAAIINICFCLVIAFICDFAFVYKSMHNAFNYDKLSEVYDADKKAYQAKQDEYGFYYYDESSSRIATSVSGDTKKAFYNDPIVQSLTKEMNEISKKQNLCAALTFGVDGLIGTFVGFLFGDVLFGIGRSLGALFTHYKVEDLNDNKVSFFKMLLYGLTKWFFYIVLGVGTLFVSPIVLIYKTLYDPKDRSPIDKWFNFILAVPEKYSSDDLVVKNH